MKRVPYSYSYSLCAFFLFFSEFWFYQSISYHRSTITNLWGATEWAAQKLLRVSASVFLLVSTLLSISMYGFISLRSIYESAASVVSLPCPTTLIEIQWKACRPHRSKLKPAHFAYLFRLVHTILYSRKMIRTRTYQRLDNPI